MTEKNIDEVLTRIDPKINFVLSVLREKAAEAMDDGANRDVVDAYDDGADAVRKIVTTLSSLQADNTALREGLGHYAYKPNWVESAMGCGDNFYVGEGDNGYDIARNTLAEVDKG